MCNCGSRRSALASQLAGTTPTAQPRVPSEDHGVSLVLRGLGGLVLQGAATGARYRFAPRAAVRVDSRDVPSLMATGRVRRSG